MEIVDKYLGTINVNEGNTKLFIAGAIASYILVSFGSYKFTKIKAEKAANNILDQMNKKLDESKFDYARPLATLGKDLYQKIKSNYSDETIRAVTQDSGIAGLTHTFAYPPAFMDFTRFILFKICMSIAEKRGKPKTLPGFFMSGSSYNAPWKFTDAEDDIGEILQDPKYSSYTEKQWDKINKEINDVLSLVSDYDKKADKILVPILKEIDKIISQETQI